MRQTRGRAVQPYRPGVNRVGDVQLPACDLLVSGGVLAYHGRMPPRAAGAGVFLSFSVWMRVDGFKVLASLDPLPHLTIKSKSRFLHISISRPDRYPDWDEMVEVVEMIAGPDLDMAMIKPRRADYVSPHPNCFHWWEMPVEWGLR